MGSGTSSSNNKNTIDKRHESKTKSDVYWSIDFFYADCRQTIRRMNRVRFLSTSSLRSVVDEFLGLDQQNSVSADQVVLAAISLGGQLYPIPKHKPTQTLQDLTIRNGSLLCFEPVNVHDRVKSPLVM